MFDNDYGYRLTAGCRPTYRPKFPHHTPATRTKAGKGGEGGGVVPVNEFVT
jgi:hypothetical protein